MLQPKLAFEIGTWEGAHTVQIASQGPPDLEIFTLDLPPQADRNEAMTDPHLIEKREGQLGRRFKNTRWEPRITQLLGDSLRFDFSQWHGRVDLVYIDGSHSYEYVVSDTVNAVAMLRDGGVAIWDDYGSMRSDYGTTIYLEALRDEGIPIKRLGPTQFAVLVLDADTRARFPDADRRARERCEHRSPLDKLLAAFAGEP